MSDLTIKKYHSALVSVSTIVDDSLETFKENRDTLFTEVKIASRVSHKIEESFIRCKIESIVDTIDILEKVQECLRIDDNPKKNEKEKTI